MENPFPGADPSLCVPPRWRSLGISEPVDVYVNVKGSTGRQDNGEVEHARERLALETDLESAALEVTWAITPVCFSSLCCVVICLVHLNTIFDVPFADQHKSV